MSEPTQQQKCADLARKMFLDAVEIYIGQFKSDTGVEICLKPGTRWITFNPYESAEDKDALLVWLAADDARWDRFDRILFDTVDAWSKSGRNPQIRAIMTAPREIIADAAWLAATSAERPKAS